MSGPIATSTIKQFRSRSFVAIEDIRLQGALEGATGRFRNHRDEALANFPNSEQLRDHLKKIRSGTLANLADHLQKFEEMALAAGSQVHWARDSAEACEIVSELCKDRDVQLVTKTKSMTTEEISLNHSLAEKGISAIETDLGEWIVQLAEEAPYHIIAPAIHKTKDQVAELLSQEAGQLLAGDNIPRLTSEARKMLREKFLAAGLGITGANIGVAESGSIVLVTNEGNAEMVTSLPPVHVVVMGIEKIAPTWDDAAAWLALLARSATGQPLSVYTTVITGPAKEADADGPEEVHIILLDNGRSHQVGGEFEEVLQCIRCGACLNICPVYREAGGHAYGSPYSGPIGAVVSPLLFGLEDYSALPQASSLCGACLDVCPVRIDLPRMLLALRNQEVEQKLVPWPERALENIAAFVLRHKRLMQWSTGLLRILQRPFLRQGFLKVPARLNPAGERDLPAFAKKPFREIWEEELKDEG